MDENTNVILPPPGCNICRFTGCGNKVIETVNSYIVENVGSVQMHEIIQQVSEIMKEENLEMTHEEIHMHIMHHIKSQKVIMNTVLGDLLAMSHVTKNASLVQCEVTGQQMVDNKMMSMYLKIVDQIITVYRMDGMKEKESK